MYLINNTQKSSVSFVSAPASESCVRGQKVITKMFMDPYRHLAQKSQSNTEKAVAYIKAKATHASH